MSFGNSGITASNIQITDATHLTVTLTISPTAATGTISVTVTTGSELATASGLLRVTAVPPTVSNVSSTTATAGDQTTISGSRFGSTQGAGQVWLGSRPGVVVSWSDNTIVAKVASGSKSGVVQVLQNGVWSNSLPFTVLTPSVTSISQNGTQVTITGSNFGATQNGGQVWLGTAYGLVQTWSGANRRSSGRGLVIWHGAVLQNGVWSTPRSL